MTGHANLKVKLPEKGSVDLIKDGKTISSLKNDDQFIFLGLEPENTYTIKVTLNSGKSLEEEEKELVLEADSVLEFVEKGKKNLENVKSDPSFEKNSEEKSTSTAGFFKGTSDSGFGHIAAYILIGLVNLAGIIVIAKILKKD